MLYLISFSFKNFLFYLFSFGCAGSSLLHMGFLCLVNRGYSLLWCAGSKNTGLIVVAHRRSCPVARGVFLDQGSIPCPLHWWILNCWTTREVPWTEFFFIFLQTWSLALDPHQSMSLQALNCQGQKLRGFLWFYSFSHLPNPISLQLLLTLSSKYVLNWTASPHPDCCCPCKPLSSFFSY